MMCNCTSENPSGRITSCKMDSGLDASHRPQVRNCAPGNDVSRRVGKGALATCPPSIGDHVLKWWARFALPPYEAELFDEPCTPERTGIDAQTQSSCDFHVEYDLNSWMAFNRQIRW